MRRLLALLLIVGYVFVQHAPAVGARDFHRTTLVADTTRQYDLHVPKSYHGAAMPLFIVLHGGLGSAFSAKLDTQMSSRADKRGFIAAYPEGTPEIGNQLRTWNAGGCCGTASTKSIDDVAFIRRVIEQTEAEYAIDKQRICITGMSNGGMLAHKIGAELSDLVAAVAPIEGCLINDLPPPAHPVSVLMFNGLDDTVVPYAGGTGSLLGYKLHCQSLAAATNFWVSIDGCSNVPIQSQELGCAKQTYTGGKNGTEVCVYSFRGGHSWPLVRASVFNPFKPSSVWSATDAICDFLLSHPKQIGIAASADQRTTMCTSTQTGR